MHPNSFLLWLGGISAAVGFAEAFVPNTGDPLGPLALPHMLASGVILFGWCKAHVRISNIREPAGSAVLCALIGIVGVPLYFFRAFGFKKGIQGTIKAFVVLALIGFAYSVTNAVGKYVAQNIG